MMISALLQRNTSAMQWRGYCLWRCLTCHHAESMPLYSTLSRRLRQYHGLACISAPIDVVKMEQRNGLLRCSFHSLQRCQCQSHDSSMPPASKNLETKDRINRHYKALLLLTAICAIVFYAWVESTLWKKQKGDKKLKSSEEKAQKPPVMEVYQDKRLSRQAMMVDYEGTWIPYQLYVQNDQFETIELFQAHDEDIFVVSFPKSGTTWLQEIVYLIHTNVDVTSASAKTIEERFPYLEYVYPGLKALRNMPSPRLIKSHLSYHLMPEPVRKGRGKVIYIARNPKDVCVSLYHFLRMFTMSTYKGTFSNFLDSFLEGKVHYGPWWNHVIGFWEQRDKPNILFLTYEDLQRNPNEVIQRIASFLGKSLKTEEIVKIVELCRFERMKDNPSANYSWWDDLGLRHKQEAHFMRKGVVGDWRNYFTEDMVRRVDKMVEEHVSPKGLRLIDNIQDGFDDNAQK